jgi:hypothetical protein
VAGFVVSFALFRQKTRLRKGLLGWFAENLPHICANFSGNPEVWKLFAEGFLETRIVAAHYFRLSGKPESLAQMCANSFPKRE